MGRPARGTRNSAAAALMACCLTVTASAQQASPSPPPSGSTHPPVGAPQAADDRLPAVDVDTLPISIDRVRSGLAREPVLRLEAQPVFRLEIQERRPRYWDLQSPLDFEVGPRAFTGGWHQEFLAMSTPAEASLYSPMFSQSEMATIAATSLLFAGAASLMKAAIGDWLERRRDGKVRKARREVDDALAAWETTIQPKPATAQP